MIRLLLFYFLIIKTYSIPICSNENAYSGVIINYVIKLIFFN